MGDDRLNEIDREIARLQEERSRRQGELGDPKRQEIRGLYESLDRILDRLDELGEDVSTDDDEAVSVAGASFRYVHGLGIYER